MIDPAFLDELKQLNFLLRKKVSTLYAGGRPSIMQGKGIEVVDYREYIPGDDIRLIDWNLYARTEKLYIKRFMEERDLIMHLLVDSSASMDFTTGGMRKFDYAATIAAGFAFLAVENEEKYACGLYSDSVKTVTDARKSKKHLYDTIRLLNNMELSGRTNMGVSATQYNKLIKSKSYVIVLSDFLEDLPSIKEGVHRLSRRSLELTLIQVLDPWETDLGWRMDVNFEDMETDEVKRTYISPGFKKEYGERIKSHTRSVQELANDFGAEFITVNTQKPLIDVFIELMGGIKRGD